MSSLLRRWLASTHRCMRVTSLHPRPAHFQILPNRLSPGMSTAQRRVRDRRCALEEEQRLGVVAPVLVKTGEVVEARRHVGVVGPEGALEDGERALEERQRTGVF